MICTGYSGSEEEVGPPLPNGSVGGQKLPNGHKKRSSSFESDSANQPLLCKRQVYYITIYSILMYCMHT